MTDFSYPSTTELAATIRAGIDVYRVQPDDTAKRFNLSQSPSELVQDTKLLDAAKERAAAKDALRQLLELLELAWRDLGLSEADLNRLRGVAPPAANPPREAPSPDPSVGTEEYFESIVQGPDLTPAERELVVLSLAYGMRPSVKNRIRLREQLQALSKGAV